MTLPKKTCPRCKGAGTITDGRGLVALRKKLGLTLTTLAEQLDVSPQFLFSVETGAAAMPPGMAARINHLYGEGATT